MHQRLPWAAWKELLPWLTLCESEIDSIAGVFLLVLRLPSPPAPNSGPGPAQLVQVQSQRLPKGVGRDASYPQHCVRRLPLPLPCAVVVVRRLRLPACVCTGVILARRSGTRSRRCETDPLEGTARARASSPLFGRIMKAKRFEIWIESRRVHLIYITPSSLAPWHLANILALLCRQSCRVVWHLLPLFAKKDSRLGVRHTISAETFKWD